MNDTILRPSFGTYHATDDDLRGKRAVWGARLIAPNDLVWDRQDLVSDDDEAKEALVHWLNNGAIRDMRRILDQLYLGGNDNTRHVIIDDERGVIVGSPQGSYGYIYVTGWLK